MSCFGDQVLSPGSSLATDFLGMVPLWRVAQRKFFQPCEGDEEKKQNSEFFSVYFLALFSAASSVHFVNDL